MAQTFKCGDIANIINDNSNEVKKSKKKTKLTKKFDKIIDENKNKVIKIEKIVVDDEDGEEEEDKQSIDENEKQLTVGKKNVKKLKKIDSKEKIERTVFVGNLPKNITIKALKKIFKKFGEIKSLRLRGAVPQKENMTKKVAVITKSLHSRKDNINAYIVYKSKNDVLKAVELNGTLLGGHRIRVDRAGNTGAHDQLRSIFVGNLPFVVKEDDLYDFFKDCGDIEAVRVVRDSKTGVGKGFGFISFKSKDSVVLALEKNEQKLKGRDLRVTRAKTESKNQQNSNQRLRNKEKKNISEVNESEDRPKKRVKKCDSKPEFEGILAKKLKPKVKKKKEINSMLIKKKQKKLAQIFSH